MNRPPHPRMLNTFHRSPRPYNHQWRASNSLRPQMRHPWGSAVRFRPSVEGNFGNNEQHWCETCDRGFPTAEVLENHKSQHQKCNIDGCQFVAHPKVITKHIQMQHSSGLYKKIANLNNPEEIQKWREERKKKYPTRSNIEKKEAECKEKIERGEKMALKQNNRNVKHISADFGKDRQHLKRKPSFDKQKLNHKTNSFKNNNRAVINKNANEPPAKKVPKVIPDVPCKVEKNKLKPFAGILNIDMGEKVEDVQEAADYSNLIDDDQYDQTLEIPKDKTITQEPVFCGALKSLMCEYESSDEETQVIVHKDINIPIINSEQNSANVTNTSVLSDVNSKDITKEALEVNESVIREDQANDSDNDSPEEVKITKCDDVEHNKSPEEELVTKCKARPVQTRNSIVHKSEQSHSYKLKRKIPSTLLQKLLHKEIVHERNVVLQCIRYIRNNKYFDK